MRVSLILIVLLSVTCVIGCGGAETDPPDFTPRRPKLMTTGAPIGDQRAYAKGVRHFAIDLYRRLDSEPGNLVFSPFGVHASIGVLTHAMERSAQDRVRDVLGADLPEVRFEAAASGVLDRIYKDSDALTHFHIGTALWLQDDMAFNERYLRRVVDFYGQQLYASDFKGDAEQVVDDINEWAAQQTDGLVQRLVDEDDVPSKTTLASTHVVSLRAHWHFAFDRQATRDADFELPGGTKVSVPTMHMSADLSYAETEHWQVVYLPYHKGKHGMFILLPKQRDGLARAAATLDGKELSLLIVSMKSTPVSLALPRFAFADRLNLTDQLKAIGLKDVFDSSGEVFVDMVESASRPLALQAITSTMSIEANEAGDVQPEMTKAVPLRDAVPGPAAVEMKCNQPFMFIVQHRSTAAILLMGRVADPRSE